MIVPLFALANAGIAIDGAFLRRLHVADHARHPRRLRRRQADRDHRRLVARDATEPKRLQPPVGWVGRCGGGTIAGIGFTVSLLVATLAFNGVELEEAKLGILSAALGATVVTWLLFRATALCLAARASRPCSGRPNR